MRIYSKISEKQKEKISKTLKIKGIKPPSQRGLKNPNVSESNRNRIVSRETREKHSLNLIKQWKNGDRKKGYRIKDKTKIIEAIARQKKSGTSIEILLENELKNSGLFYKKQFPLLGVTITDFYLPNYKIVVYADGDYWHLRPEVIERDGKINEKLVSAGFYVLRFWEHEIKESPSNCVEKIKETILRL